MNDLEKYLTGEPLTERLKALRDGHEDEVEAPAEQPRGRDTRELDDDDREHLRKWRLEPGWQIMQRLLDRWIQGQEDSVKQLSLDDPLGQRDAVANGWAYVASMRRVQTGIIGLVEAEIHKAEEARK